MALISKKFLRSGKPFGFYYFLLHLGMKHWPKKELTDFSLMISGSVQRDIGKKLVNVVLHKYLDCSGLQPINSLLGGFINDLEKAIDR